MKIISKIVVGIFFVFYVVALSSVDSVFADDSSESISKWRGGPHIGFSEYTGIIGAELQKGHWGLTIGLATTIGVRYYLDDIGYRWFLGAHAMYFDIDENETKDGICYDEMASTSTGLGMGYKWRWKDHWDLTLSLSIVYRREEFKNDFVTRTDKAIVAMPGLTFGYTF